ncbi:MAG TPA: 23S rRNA (uracil(1939)-C(5))-methyltransferase RlmD [Desulfobacteraceae bacterium]|nr:23S rRNA (uracil(1939)-C(5))-methyltransferase RlmD [Desulfobacteraceae bacterium]
MTVRKGRELEITVEKTAYRGMGVARLDGFVVFVKGGVPGDVVNARIYRKKRSFAEAEITEVVSSSPDRCRPPCRYFGFCGGCQWQHITYEKQLAYKRDQVEESLVHIGGLEPVAVHEPIPSPDLYGYRNKMEFSFSDRRWLLPSEYEEKPAGMDFALGLHVPGTFNKVIDIDRCLLQNEHGNRLLEETKRCALESDLPAYGLKSHQGFWRFLTLRHSTADDNWMVNIITSDKTPGALDRVLDAVKVAGRVKTVVNSITSRRSGVAVGESREILTGAGFLTDRIGPFSFRISPDSFFQVNPPAAEILYRVVEKYAELDGKTDVLDLYSGTGTIPVFLARKAGSVTGIEMSRDAVDDAFQNCRMNGVGNCRFLCGDTGEVLAGLSSAPDVVVIDPPRAGMHKDVIGRILEMLPERIVYVSCNPTTLARDLAMLGTAYELREIQPVDMFPHTYHIETVALLTRRSLTVTAFVRPAQSLS